jgi:hypothetical protein
MCNGNRSERILQLCNLLDKVIAHVKDRNNLSILAKVVFLCDYICILLLAHIAPYHEELVLGMHIAKYVNIIAI